MNKNNGLLLRKALLTALLSGTMAAEALTGAVTWVWASTVFDKDSRLEPNSSTDSVITEVSFGN